MLLSYDCRATLKASKSKKMRFAASTAQLYPLITATTVLADLMQHVMSSSLLALVTATRKACTPTLVGQLGSSLVRQQKLTRLPPRCQNFSAQSCSASWPYVRSSCCAVRVQAVPWRAVDR